MAFIITDRKKSGIPFPGDFVNQVRFPGFQSLGQGVKRVIVSHGQILLFGPYPGRAVSLYSPVLIKSGAFMILPYGYTVPDFYSLFCSHAFFPFCRAVVSATPPAPRPGRIAGGAF
jgi:hypothetical protein